MRLHLEYRTSNNGQYSKEGSEVQTVRIVGRLRLLLRGGHKYSESIEYVLDTGSPYIIIPKRLWRGIWKEHQRNHVVIHPGSGSKLVGSIGKVKMALLDARKRNPHIVLKVQAFLASSDEVPLIVGFHSVLENFVFHSNFPQKQVYLETLQ
jgi:hypothetical protein